MSDGLFLQLLGRETTPDNARCYLSFTARISAGTFAGATNFTIDDGSLRLFLADLERFYDSLAGQPVLVAGWGEDEYFRLTLSRHNSRGYVLAQCRVASPAVGEILNVCSVSWVIEPYALRELIAYLSASDNEKTRLLPPTV